MCVSVLGGGSGQCDIFNVGVTAFVGVWALFWL